MARAFMASLILCLLLATIVSAQEQQDNTLGAKPTVVEPLTWRQFKLEMVLGSALVGYVVMWYFGSRSNQALAKKWTEEHIEHLQQQFALVGDRKGETVLVKDGPADYLLYVSGRRNVQFSHWWIKLKPRNDWLSWILKVIFSLLGFTKIPSDHLSIDMTLDKEVSNRFVFAILSHHDAKNTRDARFDLKTFTKPSSASGLPAGLVVYSESQKLTDTIVSSKIGQVIKQSPEFRSLIITSMPEIEPEKYTGDGDVRVHIEFGLSSRAEMVHLACELPDIINELPLTQDIKSKLRKNREEVEKKYAKIAAEERAEELAKKKAAAKKAEQERIKKLSPTEQRKWEEKERVRELKKLQKKRTKRV